MPSEKQQAQGFRRAWRGTQRVLHAPAVQLVPAAAMLATIEIVGRKFARSDVHDLVTIPFLAVALYSTLHGLRSWSSLLLRPFVLLRRRSTSWLEATFYYKVGLDLRRTPPVRRAVPLDVPLAVVGLPLLALLFAGIAFFFGSDPRVIARFSYVVHSVGLTFVWILLLGMATLLVGLGAALIRDVFLNRHGNLGPRPRRNEALCYVVGVLWITLGGIFLPTWVPLASIGFAALAVSSLIWNPRMTRLEMVWQPRCGGTLASFDWRWKQMQGVSLFAACTSGVLLLALGPTMLGLTPDSDAISVTRVLWKISAWASSGALVTGAIFFFRGVIECIRKDPARPCPTRIHVEGAASHRVALDRIATARGWDLRFAPQQRPEPFDVRIRIVPSPMPAVSATETQPLPVSMRALELTELQDLLVQRDVESRRRELLSGVQLLFAHAARRKFKKGTGYWFAPHLWFVAGMSRDTDEDSTGDGGVMMQLVGPVYTKVFARPARHHFHSMMQAFEVDLMYVEDGLGFEDVRRLLRRLFARYDDPSERGRLEDSHLTGLRGVRAIIHDFELHDPFKRKGYPEPDYEDLGRARILHVFRDRGEDEDIPEIPVDLDGLLVPVT